MSVFQRAVKRQARARVALEGPTGSGKTWDALVWATALGRRIAVVDTERNSASLYAPHFEFDTVDFQPPYDPGRLVKLIKEAGAEGYEVLVIDSLSHFWEGEGGTLDIVDAAAARSRGNTYAGWKVGTPALRHLVDTLLGCSMHLVVTMRSKMEYVLQEVNGRQVPQKVGMAPVMRAGVEYEFTLVGDLDLEHRLTITKSRCDVLADWVAPKERIQEAAERFAAWLGEGEEALPPAPGPPGPPDAPTTEQRAAPATSPSTVPTGEEVADLIRLAGSLPRPIDVNWVDEQLTKYPVAGVRKTLLVAHERQCGGAACEHVTGQAPLPVGGPS